MSRREAMLEELGLSPVWVRRAVATGARGVEPGRGVEAVTGDLLGHGVIEHDPRGGRDALIATLDWEPLQARAAGCTDCPLCENRRKVVFGVGDPHAEWLIVGEAPGENEDRTGEPFVGQAGKLLDNMLRAIGVARGDRAYIANVIKCRPPGNRNPTAGELASCQPYLRRQVQLIQPKLILALGRFAAQALLETDAKIASLRGQVHRYEGVPLIVSYHPAYLLRNLPDKAKAWTDLCLAQRTYQALTH